MRTGRISVLLAQLSTLRSFSPLRTSLLTAILLLGAGDMGTSARAAGGDSVVVNVRVIPDFADPPGGTALSISGLISDPQGNNIFSGGGSKDILDISQWQWVTGAVPNKDEILHGMAAQYADGKFYIAADRYGNNGDANLGFWLLQNGIGLNLDGTFSGSHAVGDILILGDFILGGQASIVPRVYRWVGDGSGSEGNLDQLGVDASLAMAITNDNVEGSPWEYMPRFPVGCQSGFDYCFPQFSFFEGGIDLMALGQVLLFSSFLIETRSSQEVGAVLKDFVLSDLLVNVDVKANPSATGVAPGAVLGQNAPNPFAPSTIIPYSLSRPGHVRLEVFDLAGRRLTTLVDAPRNAGNHEVKWDRSVAEGRRVSSGIYFYRLMVGKRQTTRKMVLLR